MSKIYIVSNDCKEAVSPDGTRVIISEALQAILKPGEEIEEGVDFKNQHQRDDVFAAGWFDISEEQYNETYQPYNRRILALPISQQEGERYAHLKKKMRAYFDNASVDSIIAKFEEMGYKFVDVAFPSPIEQPGSGGEESGFDKYLKRALGATPPPSSTPCVQDAAKEVKMKLIWDMIEEYQMSRDVDEDINEPKFSYQDIEVDLYGWLEKIDPKSPGFSASGRKDEK